MPGRPADFAGMLRLLRGRAGWTQEDLACRAARNTGSGAGVSVTTISELERRKHLSCQRETAERLADAFGLTDPARDVFVAVARGQLPAAAMLAEDIWDTLCEQASRRGRPASPTGDRPPAPASSPDHGPGEFGQDQARLMLNTGTAGEPGSSSRHPGDQAPAAGSGTPAEPRRPAVLPWELPADVRGFIVRAAELAALLPAAADHEGGAAGAVVICAVLGMAGVGKTTLAGDAVAQFLGTLGVAGADTPAPRSPLGPRCRRRLGRHRSRPGPVAAGVSRPHPSERKLS